MHRCGYCDFNTFAGLEWLIPGYTEAVCRELELISAASPNPMSVHTVYFGGGTPSLLPIISLEQMLACVNKNLRLTKSPEITLEANPGTVSEGYLADLQALGVSRLSFGMQSAHPDELTLLERQHTFGDVVNTVDWSRAAGFTNLNLDLIYGLPNQALSSWMQSIDAALSLSPEHLSLYALTLENGTPLQHKVEAGILPQPDPDLAADMYDAASDRLAEAGYIQYEISNWAKRDLHGEVLACQHNLQYWRNQPYLGVGAGAHGFIDNKRLVNVASPQAYISRLEKNQEKSNEASDFPQTPASIEIQPIDREAEIGETMMMGLRLVLEGVSDQDFSQRFGTHLKDRFSSKIDRLARLGLLEWAGENSDVLRLTRRGRLLGNQVFCEFI
jgi:putative oxygen-independent coproporphyrinogen III oxidase